METSSSRHSDEVSSYFPHLNANNIIQNVLDYRVSHKKCSQVVEIGRKLGKIFLGHHVPEKLLILR